MAATEPEEHRYTHLCKSEELAQWHDTFKNFDRDGGGDVDLKEIGLMFRALGQTPSEAEMLALVEEVDADGSGTVDFEEFCLLMLRMQRAALCPDWLHALFAVPEGDAEAEKGDGDNGSGLAPVMETEPTIPPARVVLRGPSTPRGSGGGGGGGGGDGDDEEEEAHPPLTREQLFCVSDMLPQAQYLTSLDLSGYGPLMGPFIAEEISRGLSRLNRRIVSLDLSSNNLGDDGAESMARMLALNPTLLQLNLSSNSIGTAGANALLRGLRGDASDEAAAGAPAAARARGKPSACALRELTIEGNVIAPELYVSLHEQLLLNNLPRIYRAQLPAPAALPSTPPNPRKSAPAPRPQPPAPAPPKHAPPAPSLSPAHEPFAPAPCVTLGERWLGAAHAAALHAELLGAPHPLTLRLDECARLGGLGFAALVEPFPPQPQPLKHIEALRVTACGLDDAALPALCRALTAGTVPSLRALDLRRNRLTLHRPAIHLGAAGLGALGAALADETPQLALQLGEALGASATLADLDLGSNPISDEEAAVFCSVLLASSASLATLHLGATGAANRTAAACATALSQPSARLRALCLSGQVSDSGAEKLAAALPRCASLEELWLGDRIGDRGGEALAAALGVRGCALRALCLGGTTRSAATLRNELGPRSAAAFGRLTASASPLSALRLSGNSGIGGRACVQLLSSLQGCAVNGYQLRLLHLDGCGLGADDVPPFLEALNQVWCLHELRAEGAVDVDDGSRGGRDGRRMSWGARAKAPSAADPAAAPLFSLQQKLGMAKLLEDNRTMGRQRVESWRLARSLEEVAWVFNGLCAGIPTAVVDAGLAAWDGEACATFVTNLGLPQYAQSVSFNLSGALLPSLRMASLSQLGIVTFAHQKQLMEAVRELLNAYERKERHAKANAAWAELLSNGGDGMRLAAAAIAAAGEDDAEAGGVHARAPAPSPARQQVRQLGGRRVGAVTHRNGSRRRRAVGAGGNSNSLRLPRIATLPPADVPPPPAVSHAFATPMLPSERKAPASGSPEGKPVAQTEWGDLARSYGLHMVPDTRQMLRDNMNSILAAPARPSAPPRPTNTSDATMPTKPSPRDASLFASDGRAEMVTSPSLPILSPRQPGRRNWVSFLHGPLH